LIALDRGLQRLAEERPRHAQVIELRFFLEMSVEEAAGVLKCASRTVMRYDAEARRLLREFMDGGDK
jgi:DNA-directed RNA polymerase specialized sigma24 family protein